MTQLCGHEAHMAGPLVDNAYTSTHLMEGARKVLWKMKNENTATG